MSNLQFGTSHQKRAHNLPENLSQEDNLNFTFLEKFRSFNSQALENLSEPEQMLFELFGKGKEEELPFDKIHLAFERQVKKHPNNIAAKYQGESITYHELNRKADRLACRLIKQGVNAGSNVGLFLRRSIEMLIGMIATLKVGSAYVPQDIKITPKKLLKSIINSADIKVVLSQSSYSEKLPQEDNYRLILIDEELRGADDNADISDKIQSRSTLPDSSRASDNCFILFTSGTTGIPNGVKVSHKNLCNIILTSPGNLNIKQSSNVAQLLNIAFDMAAWEIWGALCHGATLLIRDKCIQETASQSNVVIATPSILATIDPYQCPHLKTVAVAGEPCAKPLADKWVQVADFHNCCGPTETTIVNTVKKYASNYDQLTIGKPTPNNTVYVLDQNLKPCAIGAVGEMWAGGDCVTGGYLNNQELTCDRYKPDPFLGDGKLMFRTRDLGRWTLNGELEHLGRTDDQVKVKGFRVELDSISNTLEKHHSCEKAVTIRLTEDNLICFVVPSSAETKELYNLLSSSLPYYCKPTNIHPLDKLPLTTRGKVDKKKLRDLALQSLRNAATSKESIVCEN